MDYDPGSAEVLADPAAAYAELRATCPVHRFDGLENPLFTLADRHDIHAALTDPRLWINALGPGVGKSDTNDGDMQRYDPPEHGRRRRFARPAFLPRTIARSEDSIAELADSLIDGLERAGQAELHDDYALPLPVTGFCELMGIADDDRGDFKRWADELTIAMTYPDRARRSRREMTEYTMGQVTRRRRAVAEAGLGPGDDPVGTVVPDGLLSHLACHSPEDGVPLTDREVAGMVGQLLVAGHETTTSLITNAVWRLLEEPSRWERLCSDPGLVPNVIEESLRFDPPVLGLCRTNTQPAALGEHHLPVESKAMLLYASANRDPQLFDQPDEFRIDRPLLESKRHYSFGWGIHHCLGSHLARLTGRVALERLVERLPTLYLAGETSRVDAPFLWGRRTLPVRW